MEKIFESKNPNKTILEENQVIKDDISKLFSSQANLDYNDLINKPTIPQKTSDLTNDSGFITKNNIAAGTGISVDTTGENVVISSTVTSDVNSVNGQTGTVVLSASDVNAVPTARKVNNKSLVTDISLDASDVGAVPTSRTINSKALSSDVTLSSSDVGAVPTTRTVNGKALSNDITLTSSDVGALSSSTTFVSSVNGSSGAISGVATTSDLSSYLQKSGGTMDSGVKFGDSANGCMFLPFNAKVYGERYENSGEQNKTAILYNTQGVVEVGSTTKLTRLYSYGRPKVYDYSQNPTFSGDAATLDDLPSVATTSVAGLVKPDGTTITIDGSGTISSIAGGAVDSVNGQTGSVVLSASDIGAVPTTRKVNNKALSGDITLSASDVGALPSSTSIPTKTSDLTNDSNFVAATTNANVSVAGSSKTTYTYDKTAIYAPNGLIMGGTAAAAGLVTRGVCGVSTPSTGGACTKDNLFLNYDGSNTYNSNRQVVIQAGSVGTHYGNNLYQYAAARGDAVKNFCDATYISQGGTLHAPLTVTGGDSATAGKIILTNNGQITDTGTGTLFGKNSASNLLVGHSSCTLTMRGSATRPTYNGSSLALYSDVSGSSSYVAPSQTTISTAGSVSQTLSPNTFYQFTGALTSLAITFGTTTSGKVNEFNFSFKTSSSGCTLTVPNTVVWAGGTPTISPSSTYEVSILNNIGLILEVE